MPAFLVPIIAAIGSAIGGLAGAFLIMNAGLIASGALLIGGLALSSSQRTKAKRKARDQYNAAQVDRLVNVQTSVAPRELVLGRVRKGGHVFFRGSVGSYKEKYVMLVALAAHEIDGIDSLYFNEKQVFLDAEGYVTTQPYQLGRLQTFELSSTTEFLPAPTNAVVGSVFQYIYVYTGGENSESSTSYITKYQVRLFTNYARVRLFNGAPGQQAAASVIADFPTLWTANHRGQGVAYLLCEFWYNETSYPSSLPSVTAVVRGAKLFDPRTGTTAFSENPALMQRHVLLHPQFGKRASITAAEDARIMAAANACDTAYNYGDGALPLYRAGLVVPFGSPARDVLDDLGQAMAGSWAYAAGEFYVKAGVYTAPVMILGEKDIVRSIIGSDGAAQDVPLAVATHRSRNEKLNVITPRIYDAAQDYKQVTLTPLKVPTYIARDGAELVEEVSMQAVGYAKQAHHIAGVMLRDARDPLTITLTFKILAWPLELFDIISLTLPIYGWANKEFEVRARSYSPQDGVRLTLKETSASINQPDASFPAQGFAPNTSLPRPWDILPPTLAGQPSSGTAELLRLQDGTVQARVRVQWLPVLDLSISSGGEVEVQWQAFDSTVVNSVRVGGSEVQCFLTSVPEGQGILIKARTRNSLAVSDWSIQKLHVVVGKTAPPASVADLTLAMTNVGVLATWQQPTEADVKDTWVRRGATWAASVPLGPDGSEIIRTTTSYPLGWLPAGLNSVVAKHVDTSGNQSLAETVASINIFSPTAAVANISVKQDFIELRWQDCTTSQPIELYEIKQGLVEASAQLLGTVLARFKMLFVQASGTYRYWVRAKDVAGNYGAWDYVDAVLNNPPGYSVIDNRSLTWDGTKTNAIKTTISTKTTLDMLVNTTRTLGQRAAAYPTGTDKINAGQIHLFQPSAATAKYEEIIDYLAPVSGSVATLAWQQDVIGTPDIIPTLSTKMLIGDPWVDYVGQYTCPIAGKRYLKVTLNATSVGGDDLAMLRDGTVSVTTQVESKTVTLNITDTTTPAGQRFLFANIMAPGWFNVVNSGGYELTTPNSLTQQYFYTRDADPNPLGINIGINNQSGVRITGTVTLTVTGVKTI
jgi:Putative phage tail protein